MNRRMILIEKFFRNKELISIFTDEYKAYVELSNTWDVPAFTDSSVTNRQYYLTLVQISSEEYSATQTSAISTATIHEKAVEDYISNLDVQFENLSILREEIKHKTTY